MMNLPRLLAIYMHDTYEEKSKELGWKTQEECQVPFEALPDENQEVMIAVAKEVIDFFEDIKFEKKVIRECQICKKGFWISESDNKPFDKFTCKSCLPKTHLDKDVKNNG